MFLLTLVALELGSFGHPHDRKLAFIRVILTVAGTALAIGSGLLYDHLSRPASADAHRSAAPDDRRCGQAGARAARMASLVARAAEVAI
jgi:hypothetical protein